MLLRIKTTPKAKQNKIVKISSTNYHIYTTAAPEKGKANTAIIKLLSKKFNIAKSKIIIIKGLKSKNKTISILVDKK